MVPSADKLRRIERNGPSFARHERPDFPPSQAVASGVELFAQGAMIDDVVFINEGVVKLVRVERDGRELIVGLRLAGWFLGSTSALLGRPVPASAITLSRCRVQRVAAPGFFDQVKSDPELSWDLHQAHSREIHDNIERLAQLGCLRSRQRLEHVLRELASARLQETGSHEIQLELPMRHYEIAGLIAVTPEHLSRLLHQMEEEGLIRLEGGSIVVPDPSRL